MCRAFCILPRNTGSSMALMLAAISGTGTKRILRRLIKSGASYEHHFTPFGCISQPAGPSMSSRVTLSDNKWSRRKKRQHHRISWWSTQVRATKHEARHAHRLNSSTVQPNKYSRHNLGLVGGLRAAYCTQTLQWSMHTGYHTCLQIKAAKHSCGLEGTACYIDQWNQHY